MNIVLRRTLFPESQLIVNQTKRLIDHSAIMSTNTVWYTEPHSAFANSIDQTNPSSLCRKGKSPTGPIRRRESSSVVNLPFEISFPRSLAPSFQQRGADITSMSLTHVPGVSGHSTSTRSESELIRIVSPPNTHRAEAERLGGDYPIHICPLAYAREG